MVWIWLVIAGFEPGAMQKFTVFITPYGYFCFVNNGKPHSIKLPGPRSQTSTLLKSFISASVSTGSNAVLIKLTPGKVF